MGRETVDRDPLVAFARRMTAAAEYIEGDTARIQISSEYLRQTRAWIDGYDAGVAAGMREMGRGRGDVCPGCPACDG